MTKRLVAVVALILAIVAGLWVALSDESTSAPPTDAAVTSSPRAAATKQVATPELPKATDEIVGTEHAAPIRGYVHAIGGGPIEGALVELVRQRDANGRTVLATTRTDAAGKFALKAERWNPETSVTASAPGLARASTQAAPGVYVDLALAVGGRLRGRVFDQSTGAPLAGTLVAVYSELGALQQFEERTVTAADGTYEFAHVLPWTIGVRAVPQGRPIESARVDVRAGATTTLDFPIVCGGIVTGRVTRAGRPIGGARVSLWNGFEGTPVVTGDDGGFTLAGFAGDESMGGEAVVATADGPVYGYTLLPRKPMREVRADVDLTNAWTIRGVVTSGGSPVARARVERGSWLGCYGGWHHVIEARDDGTFEIAADEFDPCDVSAESPDALVLKWVKVVRPRNAQLADGVVIDLPVTVEVRARVVSADGGTPIPGATVLIANAGHPAGSDEAGVVRMRLVPPGACTASAWALGYLVVQRPVNIEAGAANDLGDFALARGGSSFVAGHARTPDGAPLASVAVQAVWSKDHVRQTLTGADGGFRFDGLPPGPGTLEARFPGYATAARENVTANSENVELVLEPIVPRLTATVTRSDGFPAHRYSVTGYVRRVVEGRPDEIGCMRATLVHAPDGRFTPSEWPWLDAVVREVEVVCDDEVARVPVTLVEGGTADVRVTLAPGATIRGTIAVPGGGVPESVVWALRSGEGTSEVPSNRRAKSDRNGRFEIGPLVPGQYLLTIDPGSAKYPRHVVGVDVRADAANDIIVTLSSGTIRVRVLDADGAPFANADASLFHPDGTAAYLNEGGGSRLPNDLGRTAADGTLTSPRVDPGRYLVRVIDNAHSPYRRAECDVEVRADETTDVEIRLPR